MKRIAKFGDARSPKGGVLPSNPPKKKVNYSKAMLEAKALVWAHRWRLALGLVLMLVSRLLGMALPTSTKYVIDEVIGKQRTDMLGRVAVLVALATLLQAITSFALSHI